ncbi:MAG: energy-coupling factor ABC transporter permease [Oscillospiraceae bacterium]
MHMADALLSPTVGAAMCAVSAAAIAVSVVKIKKDELTEKKVPIMGVMGAFVFSAQIIKFTITATGTSGHVGGGILLAAMLGAYPSFLTITSVLLIQALFFADGGLLALGCNVFNMGFISCLIMYPLIFKPIVKKGISYKRITIASILSVVAGLQLGAFGVVLETLASGITELPFSAFLLMMQPIHLAIGLVEGIITAAVLCFVYSVRPEILECATEKKALPSDVSVKKVVAIIAVAAVIIGGGLSMFASAFPDGLEWSMEKVAGTSELEADSGLHSASAAAQQSTAFLPDYDYADSGEEGSRTGTSVSGLAGGAITFALAAGAGIAITAFKKKKSK